MQGKDSASISIMRYLCASDTQGDFDKLRTISDLFKATTTDSPDKQAARNSTGEALKAIKMRLPMWFTGGVCFGNHEAANITPAGIIAVDVDDLSQDRVPVIRARLAAIPHVFFAAASASGRGVYALMRVAQDVQTSQDKILEPLGILDAVILRDRRDGEHLDTACKDLARRRFESYDPACYFEPAKLDNAYSTDYRTECRRAFKKTQLATLAGLFGGRGDKDEGSAQAGLATAALAVAAGGRVCGRVFTKDFYPARSQVVVLGASGDGKSTAAGALRRVASAIGARPVSAESDRALEAALVESGLRKVDGDGDPEWEQVCPPIPLLSITDEAGDEQASRRAREYKSRMNAIRRRTYDTLFHASASLTTRLPQKDFHCSYTDVQLSTPKRWADALRGTDNSTGERRRVLEFWAAGIEEPNGALNPALAQIAAMTASAPEPANVDAIVAVLETLRDEMPYPDRECVSLYLDGVGAVSEFEQLRAMQTLQASGAGIDGMQDARTMICGLATLIAWADRLPVITADAIRAAWAIVFAVQDNRSKLLDMAEVGAVTQEAEISGEILEYIGARSVRVSSVKRMLARRGGAYTRAYKALIDAGALVIDKGKSPTVRAATEAEAEEAASKPEPPAKKQCPSVWDGQTNGAPKPYDACDDVEKLERLAKYRAEFERDKPITPGARDNHLRALRFQLERVGMWDELAAGWFRDVCDEVGFVQKKDQDRLSRPIRGLVNT